VLLDDLIDVVAFEWHGEGCEGSGDGVAGRERRRVVVDGHRLVVPGDHHDTVAWLAPRRPVLPEVLVVRIRILVEPSGAEVVHRVELGFAYPASHLKSSA